MPLAYFIMLIMTILSIFILHSAFVMLNVGMLTAYFQRKDLKSSLLRKAEYDRKNAYIISWMGIFATFFIAAAVDFPRYGWRIGDEEVDEKWIKARRRVIQGNSKKFQQNYDVDEDEFYLLNKAEGKRVSIWKMKHKNTDKFKMKTFTTSYNASFTG